MKIYSKKTVLEAAIERIEYLFDEFPNIIVGFSGGKDSTVILNLALTVAEKKNKLPLKVMFIDQEAEWEGTIKYIENVFKDPRIEPLWFQMQMKWNNNIDGSKNEIVIWDENDSENWLRPKKDGTIQVNKYMQFGFQELFGKILEIDYKGEKTCYLAGMRTEESPKRHATLTYGLTYKSITWGKKFNKIHYTFYPIYDWSYRDVWKYIFENNIQYNEIYDKMYSYGVNVNEMRISNLHHETSLRSINTIQEIEPETWNKITNRHIGISSIKHLKKSSYTCPTNLPSMFQTWEEYACYLAENLINELSNKEKWYKEYENLKSKYGNNTYLSEKMYKVLINTILSYDWDFTKVTNWEINIEAYSYRLYLQGKYNKINIKHLNIFTDKEIKEIYEHRTAN